MTRKTPLLIISYVSVLLLLFFICIAAVITLFGIGDGEKFVKKFRHVTISLDTKKTSFGSISLQHDLRMDEYISFKDEESSEFHLISNYGTSAYYCTGTCYCENERRSTSSSVSRSMSYFLTAVSSLLAINIASRHFRSECETEMSSFCDKSSVKSFVEVCEETLEEQFPKNEDEWLSGESEYEEQIPLDSVPDFPREKYYNPEGKNDDYLDEKEISYNKRKAKIENDLEKVAIRRIEKHFSCKAQCLTDPSIVKDNPRFTEMSESYDCEKMKFKANLRIGKEYYLNSRAIESLPDHPVGSSTQITKKTVEYITGRVKHKFLLQLSEFCESRSTEEFEFYDKKTKKEYTKSISFCKGLVDGENLLMYCFTTLDQNSLIRNGIGNYEFENPPKEEDDDDVKKRKRGKHGEFEDYDDKVGEGEDGSFAWDSTAEDDIDRFNEALDEEIGIKNDGVSDLGEKRFDDDYDDEEIIKIEFPQEGDNEDDTDQEQDTEKKEEKKFKDDWGVDW